jgi:NaMN:DMB phosphoribosyltransferase
VCLKISYSSLYTTKKGEQWLESHQTYDPVFACILGFTSTGLIPGVSAAGLRQKTENIPRLRIHNFYLRGLNLIINILYLP